MRAEMDADIGVRVSTHLTDARTGTRCRWYTRLAAECTCPPAQARCPPSPPVACHLGGGTGALSAQDEAASSTAGGSSLGTGRHELAQLVLPESVKV